MDPSSPVHYPESPTGVSDVRSAEAPPWTSLSFSYQGELSYGCLQGIACTIDKFWYIPSEYGKYELVSGTLKELVMADAHHSATENFLSSLYISENGASAVLTPICNASVLSHNGSLRYPDFTLGTPSYGRRQTDFNPRNLPFFAAEVTSNNRNNDLIKTW
eukprot:IDg6287t1